MTYFSSVLPPVLVKAQRLSEADVMSFDTSWATGALSTSFTLVVQAPLSALRPDPETAFIFAVQSLQKRRPVLLPE